MHCGNCSLIIKAPEFQMQHVTSEFQMQHKAPEFKMQHAAPEF